MQGSITVSNRVPTIHIVDDDDDFRKALARLLLALGYEVQSYKNAGDFLLAEKGDGPGCLLLDFCMPGPSGLELQNALVQSDCQLPTIFLSGRADIPVAVEAIKNGAEDFLSKPVDQEKLIVTIEKALARYESDRSSYEQKSTWLLRYNSLTERQKIILDSVVSGKLNKQIADELGLSERTVKAHRANVMEKMQANSVAELVRIAVQLDINGAMSSG